MKFKCGFDLSEKFEENKEIIGVVLIFLGIVLGLYVGIWLCFVGGIVSIIDQIKAVETSSLTVAWGICRIIFSAVFGCISAFFLVIPGVAMLKD